MPRCMSGRIGVTLKMGDGSKQRFEKIIFACNADQAGACPGPVRAPELAVSPLPGASHQNQ